MANKQRIQVESGLGPTAFRPGTAHVDTYTQTPAGRQLSQLAGALSGIAPSLQRFSNVMAEEEKQSAIAQAEADMRAWDEARKDNDGIRQAIREGALRPDQSPWYRWAAKQYFGRKAATDYEAALAHAVESELGDSYDVEDFNELETRLRKEFMDGFAGEHRDSTFDQAFGREADARVAGMRTNFSRAAGGRLRQFTLQNLEAVVSEHVSGFAATVPDLDDEEGYAALAGMVQREMDRLIGVGEHPIAVNNAVRNALVRLAAQEGSELDVKKLANLIVTDKQSGAKLGHILAVERALDEAQDDAINDRHRKLGYERQEQAWAQQDAYNRVTTDYITQLSEASNPATLRPEEFVAQLRDAGVTDPSMLQAPYQFYQNAIEGRATTNQQLLNDLWVGVAAGSTTLSDIRSAVALTRNGISARDGAFLWNALQEHTRSSGSGVPAELAEEALGSKVWTQFQTRFRGRFDSLDLSDVEKARIDDAVAQAQQYWISNYARTRSLPDGGANFLNNIGESVWRGTMTPEDRNQVLTDLGPAGNRWLRQDDFSLPEPVMQRAFSEMRSTGRISVETAQSYMAAGILPEQAAIYTIEQARARGYELNTN